MRRLFMLFAVLLLLAVPGQGRAADYALAENWAYCEADRYETPVDVFFVAPTVGFGDKESLNLSLGDEKGRKHLLGAVNMEKGIYDGDARFFSPYYGMANFSVFSLPAKERDHYLDVAYADVRAAFLYYLAKYNDGRPVILAGFSQGGYHVLRLLKEFFKDEELQGNLVAAYVVGWPVTGDDLRRSPHLQVAQGETDTGVIISFNSEAPSLKSSPLLPEGMQSLSINPLNWRTDGQRAHRSLNRGACFPDYEGNIKREISGLAGAYIDPHRGALKVTDVSPEDYPPLVEGFGEGVYHVYDYQFFYRNLQENVTARVDAYFGADSGGDHEDCEDCEEYEEIEEYEEYEDDEEDAA